LTKGKPTFNDNSTPCQLPGGDFFGREGYQTLAVIACFNKGSGKSGLNL
jgi:hypothetical protein